MKIYLLKQNVNKDYDTYDSCIVCAENEEEAKRIHPSDYEFKESDYLGDWVSKFEEIECIELGLANSDLKKGVILASFNAG